jgi:hypothetical protein
MSTAGTRGATPGTGADAPALKVFISCSRKDADFLRRLMVRVLTALALVAAGLLVAPAASAQMHPEPEAFDSLFLRNPGGGEYAIGEDLKLDERLRAGAVLFGEISIVEPHRTMEHAGSGVALNIYDAARQQLARIVFVDVVGRETLGFSAEAVRRPTGFELVDVRHLSARHDNIVGFTLQVDKSNRLTVTVERQTVLIELGFVADIIEVEIFCGKGWARFGDPPGLS